LQWGTGLEAKGGKGAGWGCCCVFCFVLERAWGCCWWFGEGGCQKARVVQTRRNMEGLTGTGVFAWGGGDRCQQAGQQPHQSAPALAPSGCAARPVKAASSLENRKQAKKKTVSSKLVEGETRTKRAARACGRTWWVGGVLANSAARCCCRRRRHCRRRCCRHHWLCSPEWRCRCCRWRRCRRCHHQCCRRCCPTRLPFHGCLCQQCCFCCCHPCSAAPGRG